MSIFLSLRSNSGIGACIGKGNPAKLMHDPGRPMLGPDGRGGGGFPKLYGFPKRYDFPKQSWAF
jgi:hypothetical protein